MPGIGSTAMMTAMLSASTAMKQTQVQNGIRAGLNGRAGVLETEIKLDGGRGDEESAARKQEELSRIQQAAQDTETSQMGSLSKANEAMKEAVEKERESEKTENDSAGKNRVDQVEVSQAGEKEAEKDRTMVAEIPNTAAYSRDGSLSSQAAAEVSFSVTA